MVHSDRAVARAAPQAGIGLRAPHVAEIVATRPAVAWLEAHPENYMGGGPAVRQLDRVRETYPVALHGVGLSLGSADGIDRRHLARLKILVERIEPILVSEHLSWSRTGGAYLNHLLPLPFTEETLEVLCRHVDETQRALGRAILVENPSAYLRFHHSPIPEPEFLGELARRTGCGLLCDLNNVWVTCRNLGLDPDAWVDALSPAAVGEIHLAGHAVNEADERTILIDDHGSRVGPEVWRLHARAVARFGPVPTLVEWDTDIPALAVLLAEARQAACVMESACGAVDARAG